MSLYPKFVFRLQKLQSKNVVLMIQARVNSKRFPKKVLAKIESKPMIWHVINRIKKVKKVKEIVLITTQKKDDRILLKIAKESGIQSFSGDEKDVLNRHYQCALKYNADVIIRITGDCPLIDPEIVEKMLDLYIKHDYDYITNTLVPTFPDGLDTEILSFKVLKKIANKAKLPSEREHVTAYIRNNQDKFRIFNYENQDDLSYLRFTVDEKKDLKLVRKIYSRMRPKKIFSLKSIIKTISKYPKIVEINAGISRNEGYLKSLKMDKVENI
jgi:spore coat polysaccharide biosynthesis protein SpsF